MFQDRDQHSSADFSPIARARIPTKGYLMKLSLLWMASLSPSPTTLRHILWMASLSPSPTIFHHLFQMEFVNPFPTSSTTSIISDECKFLGTLVFNHLPPLDHERQTSQSTSSGLRRLNRGSCCTPKFSLSF